MTEKKTRGRPLEDGGLDKAPLQVMRGEPERAAAMAEGETPGYTVHVYCGPTLPGGRLNANMILRGTRAEILAAYREVFETYPQAARLVVPVCKVADTKRRIRAGGNLYSKYYKDAASAAHGRKGETK